MQNTIVLRITGFSLDYTELVEYNVACYRTRHQKGGDKYGSANAQ